MTFGARPRPAVSFSTRVSGPRRNARPKVSSEQACRPGMSRSVRLSCILTRTWTHTTKTYPQSQIKNMRMDIFEDRGASSPLVLLSLILTSRRVVATLIGPNFLIKVEDDGPYNAATTRCVFVFLQMTAKGAEYLLREGNQPATITTLDAQRGGDSKAWGAVFGAPGNRPQSHRCRRPTGPGPGRRSR